MNAATTETISNKAATKLIDRAYAALDRLNDIDLTHHRDKIYALAATGERQHRRGRRGEYHCTVSTAAKLFVVRWLATYATSPEKLPDVKDMLAMRDDVVLSAMVAANYRDEIIEALKGFDLQQLLSINYVKLVEGDSPRSALDYKEIRTAGVGHRGDSR